ncbi:MAG: nucleotidyltransferase domain-containing protein [Smithella sp.]|nr:nucleotidyltransferase domain-containing protein [Smithella sp.]
MDKKEVVNAVKKYKKALAAEGIAVSKMVLYGSYANGRFHKDSDIDLAVVSPDFGKNRHEEGVKLFRLAYDIDPRIEPVPLSLKAYEKDTWVPLVYEIRTKGVEIKA